MKVRQLDPSTYEHPTDRTALAALKKVPLLDKLGTMLLNYYTKTNLLVEHRGNAVEVNDKILPRVNKLKNLAAERLCLNMQVPLFVTLDWNYNAFTSGVTNPIIVVNSSIVENYSDEELLFIIGHEMGHIKSKHMLYHWMASNMSSWMFNNSIISGLALQGLVVALNEWSRKSELTADRAGFIACDNREAAIMGLMKLMGLPESFETSSDWHFSVDEITDQLDSHEEFKADSLYKKFIYALLTNNIDHPWTIERIKEIRNWEKHVQYYYK